MVESWPHKEYDRMISFIREAKGELWHLDWKRMLLERLKDEDLPLFIHYDWEIPEIKAIYMQRLKGEYHP